MARPVLGLLPLGSGWDLARSLGLPRDLDAALGDCYHYGIARSNGQLASVTVTSVPDLSSLLHDSWEALHKRSGDAKSARLIIAPDFAREILARCPVPGSLQ